MIRLIPSPPNPHATHIENAVDLHLSVTTFAHEAQKAHQISLRTILIACLTKRDYNANKYAASMDSSTFTSETIQQHLFWIISHNKDLFPPHQTRF